jgi:hypothetical protein
MQLNQFDFIEVELPGCDGIKECYFFENYTDEYFVGITKYKDTKYYVSIFIADKKFIKRRLKTRGSFLILEKIHNDSIFLFDNKHNVILLHNGISEQINRMLLCGKFDLLFFKPTFFNKLKHKLKSILKNR